MFGSAGPTPTGPGGPSGGHVSAAVLQFLAQAEKDYNKAQAALRTGNLGQYYQDICQMKAALDQARNAAAPAKSGSGRHQAGPDRRRAVTLGLALAVAGDDLP